MKRFLNLLIIAATCAGCSLFNPANAQVRQPVGNQRQPTQTGGNRYLNKPMASSENHVVQSQRFIPRPDPIKFMTWRPKLTREETIHFAGGTNATHVMDNKTTLQPGRPGGHASATLNNMNNHVMQAAAEAVASRHTADGHNVSHTLTTNTSDWENKPNYLAIYKYRGKPKDSAGFTCTTSTISINARSTTFMNPSPDLGSSKLLPGMIYAYDEYSSGNFNQRYNVGRNPMNLVSNVLRSQGPINVTVNDPNLGNISDGIGSLVRQYAPEQAGSNYKIQATLTDNISDQDIFVSAGGSYGAFEGSASLRHKENENHIYYTIDAVKEMYTINAQPAANGLYPNGVPAAGSPLVMLSGVTFGARVLANMDIEIKSTSNLGNLHLSYNDGMESARADMEALFANSTVNITINGYLIGFPTQFPGSFSATKENFFAMMDQFFSGCNYSTARPISYSLVNMEGDQVGIYSATDNFTVPECTPTDETFTLQSVMAVIQTGDDAKNSNSEFWLTIGAGDPQHIRWAGQFYDNRSEFKRDGNSWQIPIPLNGNIFTVDDFNKGLVALKLIEHGHSGDDWNIQDLKLTFNFVSQKGTPHPKVLDISNFTLHDTKDASRDSRQIYFQNSTDANTYVPQ